MNVATHHGRFHADDVFSIATLKLAGVVTSVIRTRDPGELAKSDLRVDIGRLYDPTTGDFDHHQLGGAGQRKNGIPYASFGLIWKEYGTKVAGSDEAARRIDENLVQIVDADDVGKNIFSSNPANIRPYDVPRIVSNFNPSWEEGGPSAEEVDKLFDDAVDFATIILKQEIRRAQGHIKAAALVREAIKKAGDPRIIILDKFAPWKEIVIPEATKALYIVYPVWPAVRNQWSVYAVNKSVDSFECRQKLPEPWAGKEGQALADITGVDDAVFCHSARFLIIAESKDSAVKLAKLALGEKK